MITANALREMSERRGEPGWMREARLESARRFHDLAAPTWGGGLSDLDFGDVVLDKVGLDGIDAVIGAHSDAAGQATREEADAVARRNQEQLAAQGVVFCPLERAVTEYPQFVEDHLGSVVSTRNDKLAALNAAGWSGGWFVYVPPGVEVEVPLQVSGSGDVGKRSPIERTLIIADEGSRVHYIEGCSAPTYTSQPLFSTVVEVVVKPAAQVTHTNIQNWSGPVVEVITKRAHVEAEGQMTWIEANLGSQLTVSHSATVLAGPKASGAARSVTYAGSGQHQAVGPEMIHAAPETSSEVVAKSIAKGGGRVTSRSLVRGEAHDQGCSSAVRSDALLLDAQSVADLRPSLNIGVGGADDAVTGHTATVERIADEQLLYLQSRGLTAEQAMSMIVTGFSESVTSALPLEYAVEWARLIELRMEGSVG